MDDESKVAVLYFNRHSFRMKGDFVIHSLNLSVWIWGCFLVWMENLSDPRSKITGKSKILHNKRIFLNGFLIWLRGKEKKATYMTAEDEAFNDVYDEDEEDSWSEYEDDIPYDDEEDVQYLLKIMVIGEAGVGKTSLVHRFVDNVFNPMTKSTIGVDFSLKNEKIELEDRNITVQMQIWDFAGEVKFRELLPLYVRGTRGLLMAFDLSRLETLDALPEWKNVIFRTLKKEIPFIVIGMKEDLLPEDLKNDSDFLARITEKVRALGADDFLMTSAKTGRNVRSAFYEIAKLVIERSGKI